MEALEMPVFFLDAKFDLSYLLYEIRNSVLKLHQQFTPKALSLFPSDILEEFL